MGKFTTSHCPRCKYPHGTHAFTCSYTWQKPPIEERFWSYVQKSAECWNWMGAQDGHGYGHLYYHGRMQKAHRIVYQLTYGAIPPKTMVCHHCDNPQCVRPDHLFLGNHTTNALDMASKGRQVFQRRPERATRGEQHYCAKLTDGQVQTIRQQHKQGVSMDVLAQHYGVSKQSIWRIVRRLTWKHI